ncbi:MAG: class SAM-dependent methyltransferase [Candidatus Eremiobacteraeota bacterium]|nr:class SAM-dependent methyltransferase [Candidatus Eremiobacteraeota bacterium]
MQREYLLQRLKRVVIRTLDDIVVPIVNVLVSNRIGGVIPEVMDRVVRDAADYCDAKMGDALMFTTRERLWSYALRNASDAGVGLEFGVFEGASLRFFAQRRPQQKFVGFDSFAGLKEDWAGWQYTKGHFDKRGELPDVPANVSLVAGWFDETVPGFAAQLNEPVSFVHVDCDTYESTCVVLGALAAKLRPGAVIVFDEYFGYRGWRNGEFRAWQELVAARGLAYRYLAFSNMAVAVAITE